MSVESDDRTLYIGNLDKNVSEEILYELFLQAGPVERVNIVSNSNESFRYGFVTYKHEISIDYAIKLYKGTNLYKKELLIKRRGSRSGSNSEQLNDFNKHSTLHSRQAYDRLKTGFQNFTPDSIFGSQQNLQQNIYLDPQPLMNFPPVSVKGNRSNRSKPYDHGPRNYSSRSRDSRERHKEREYGNKSYHGRKSRH